MPRKRSPVAIAAGKLILAIQKACEEAAAEPDTALAQRVLYRARTLLRAAQSASISSLLDGRSVAEYLDPGWVETHPSVQPGIAALIAVARSHDLGAVVDAELEFFESPDQRSAFESLRITPVPTTQRWQYSEEEHECLIVARNSDVQIVYCASGFGPSFPWSIQRIGATDLGMDGDWHAYLYESFISGMWHGAVPEGFERKGPGERTRRKFSRSS